MGHIIPDFLRTITTMWRGPRKVGGEWFYPFGKAVNVWCEIDPLLSFLEVPEVNAIINRSATYFSLGNLSILDKKGKDVTDKYPDVAARLKKPNWFQDQKEFMRQTKLFHDIFGNEYMYNLYPLGMSPARSKGLFTLPPNLVTLKYTGEELFFTIAEAPKDGIKYTYKVDGADKPLPADAIIHLNDNKVSSKKGDFNKDFLTGESKLMSNKAPINNIRYAYESRGVILKKRGALGILSNSSNDKVGPIPMNPDDIEKVQEQYRRYGGLEDQDQLIISAHDLRWTQMAISPDKLGLYQETEESFNKLLDSYGFTRELFVKAQGSTYENQNQAQKGCFQNKVIPEANEWCAALNSRLMVDTDDRICIDYTHLPIFQEDLKYKGEAWQAFANSLNRMLQDGAITSEEYAESLRDAGIKKGKGKPVNVPRIGAAEATTTVLAVQTAVNSGATTREAGIAMLIDIVGFTEEQAARFLVEPKEPEDNGQTQEEQPDGPGAGGEDAGGSPAGE